MNRGCSIGCQWSADDGRTSKASADVTCKGLEWGHLLGSHAPRMGARSSASEDPELGNHRWPTAIWQENALPRLGADWRSSAVSGALVLAAERSDGSGGSSDSSSKESNGGDGGECFCW